jgi:phosphatidate cytidylyltransferase
VAVCKAGSIGAYFVGKTWGKHPMTPVVSPNKTVAGAVGALAASVLVSVGLSLSPWKILDLEWAVAFGLFVAIAGMLGDLAASLLKREADVKDSGSLVRGFGGMIDMLDDILFGAPVAFFLLVAAECL